MGPCGYLQYLATIISITLMTWIAHEMKILKQLLYQNLTGARGWQMTNWGEMMWIRENRKENELNARDRRKRLIIKYQSEHQHGEWQSRNKGQTFRPSPLFSVSPPKRGKKKKHATFIRSLITCGTVFPIIFFPRKNKTRSTNHSKVFSEEAASFGRLLALRTLYNLSYTGAFRETINFLKYTQKLAIFKPTRYKLVLRHIVFVFISMCFFERRGVGQGSRENWAIWPFTVRERKVCRKESD